MVFQVIETNGYFALDEAHSQSYSRKLKMTELTVLSGKEFRDDHNDREEFSE